MLSIINLLNTNGQTHIGYPVKGKCIFMVNNLSSSWHCNFKAKWESFKIPEAAAKILSLSLFILSAIAIFLFSAVTTYAIPVESHGTARLDYTINLPANIINVSEYQHTHAEAGLDISTGIPSDVSDDYTSPGFSSSIAQTTHSWGYAEADTANDYIETQHFASADSSVSESWGYGYPIYKLFFTLGAQETIDIGYSFNAHIWVNSMDDSGSAFSTALFSIYLDNYSTLLYDPAPDFVSVNGIGFQEKYLSDAGSISHVFGPGDHQIIYTLDSYGNAVVPEPGTLLLLCLGMIGLVGFIKRRPSIHQ